MSGLTHEQIIIACKNIGYDLTCGSCAAVFFTGYGGYPHTCASTDPVVSEVAALEAQLTAARAENERLREALERIRAWDMLNPGPLGDVLADAKWLRGLIADALKAGAK